MMINDPLSDMIARIKNAATRKRSSVLTPASKLRQRVLDVLADELQKLAADPGFQGVITGSPEVLGVEDVRGAEVILRGRLRTRPDKRWMVKREALKRVTERFESEGIFPPS